MSCSPGASSVSPAASGRNCHGWVSARRTMCGPGSRIGRRSRSSGRSGANSGSGISAIWRANSSVPDMGAFTVQAARSLDETPRRSSVPVIEPAEVPTIMSASRASKP